LFFQYIVTKVGPAIDTRDLISRVAHAYNVRRDINRRDIQKRHSQGPKPA
jgi:hypothetical protein